MPTHVGGNDRSANGTYLKHKRNPGKGVDNARDVNQQNVERAERRERRERMAAKSQLEHVHYKAHLNGADAVEGTVPAKVIKH